MNFKKLIVFYVIAIFLFSSIFSIQVGAEVNQPVSIHIDSGITSDRGFVMTSNGTYVAIQFDDDEDNYNVFASYDQGATWVERTGWDNMSAVSSRDFSCYIDDNDYIHVAIMNKETYQTNYKRYKESTDTWDRPKIIDANGGYDTDECLVLANQDNDVMVIWIQDNTGGWFRTKMRYYHEDISTWSGATDLSDSTILQGMVGDVDQYGNFVYCGIDGNDLDVMRYNINNDSVTEKEVVNTAYVSSGDGGIDFMIDGNNVYHFVYVTEENPPDDKVIYYTYGTWDGGFATPEKVYESTGHDANRPEISYTTDGDVNIVWDAQDQFTSTDYILGVEGSYGDWSDLYYYSVASDDDNQHAVMQYQRYPSSTWLTDGVIGVYENTTDNRLMFFSEGTQIQYEGSNDSSSDDILTDEYDYVGCLDCLFDGATHGTYRQYLEHGFFVPMDVTIQAIDLYVEGSVMTSYYTGFITAYLNKQNIGNPQFIDNTGTSAFSIYRWNNLNIDVENDNLYVEFGNSQKIDATNYWMVGVQNGDCNGDGYNSMFSHSDPNKFGNGNDGIDDIGSWELCVVFYFDQEEITPDDPWDNETLGDELDFYFCDDPDKVIIHPTFDIKSFYKNQGMCILWSVADITMNNRMYIYDKDNSYALVGTSQGFSPKTLDPTYSGVEGFVPSDSGNFSCVIIRGGSEVVNRSFYVYETQPDVDPTYKIWTIPPISKQLNPYDVYYNYGNTEKEGYLALFIVNSLPDLIIDWDHKKDYRYIGTGWSNGSFTYSPSSLKSPHIWVFFAKLGTNEYVPVGSPHYHLVESVVNPNIYLYGAYKNIEITGDYADQRFHYSQPFLGVDVWIFVNGEKSVYIGNSQQSPPEGVYYRVYTAGTYIADMRVRFNDTWEKLVFDDGKSSWTFYVSGGSTPPPPQPPDDIISALDIYGFITSLPALVRIILGVVIIFLFVVSPIALIKKLDIKFNVDIPREVYAIMGGVGLCVSTLIGCWGWEIPMLVFSIIAMSIFGKIYYDRRSA